MLNAEVHSSSEGKQGSPGKAAGRLSKSDKQLQVGMMRV